MVRTVIYRMDVMRNGVKHTMLKFSAAPRILMSAESRIKLSMSGTFTHNDAVDYINDELRPIMTIDSVDYPLGMYKIVSSDEEIEGSARYDQIEAYDRGITLQWAKAESRPHYAAGTTYTSIISSLLADAGIARSIVTPSTLTIATDREDWDIGTDYLTIINTLCAEINYTDIWFDLNGIAHVEPYTAPKAENISHTYDATTASSVTRAGVTKSKDLYNTPNVFIVVCSNPDLAAPMTATAENNSYGSPLSIVSRGLRVPAIYTVDNIANQSALQEYANKLRDEATLTSETITFETATMPTHQVGDIIALNHPSASGIYKETEWEIRMKAGSYMQHTMKKVIVV